MNFKAYGELRLLGYDPETAVELSKSYQPVGMYEQKDSRDWPNHGPSPVRCIGLKAEFKQGALALVKESENTAPDRRSHKSMGQSHG